MTKGVGGSTAELELAAIAPWADRAPPIARDEYLARQDRARALLDRIGADSLIVGAGHSLRYFTGVAWGATERLVALVLPRTGVPVMICPAFELGSLEASLAVEAEIRLWEEDESPFALAAQAAGAFGTRLAFDPALPFFVFNGLRLAAPELEIVDGAPVIDGCRRIKSAAELALMSQAKAMTLEVHRRAARMLMPGIKASEVRRFIDSAHRAIGADNGSSFCAVQFDRATAYPHGLPGDQDLREGDLVLIDTGCLVQGYNSDITAPTCSARPATSTAGSGRWSTPPRPPPSPPCVPAWPAKRSTARRAQYWSAMASAPAIACPACRTAPATASACRSTSRPIWCAATRPRWSPACASPTSR